MEQTKRNAHKEDGVLAFHAYQSFLPGEVTAETAHQIGLELAHQMWGDDFEVLVCTHTDKKHFHNHFVINSVSWTTYKRFLNKHSDYDKMRRLSDALCEKYRLNVITDPKKGVHYSEWQAKKQKKPTRRTLIEDDLERAIASSRTFTQFLQYLKSIGYDVKTNVKHIAVKPPGAPRFFRLYKVIDDGTYSEENIKKRIIEQDLYFEKRTRIKSKYQYYGNIKKAKKITGIKALYFHYMYRMGIIPKNVPSRRKVHFIFKEDLRYMDRITEETTFLCKKKINTIEDMENYESEISNKIEKLVKERRCLYNKVKRYRNLERKEMIQKDIETISKEIKDYRKEVKLCEGIKQRSLKIKDKLQTVKEQENKVQERNSKERKRNY